MEIPYHLSNGEQIGKMEFEVCQCFEELCLYYKFESTGFRSGFPVVSLQDYLATAELEEKYPMAFAKEIEIFKEFRDQGFGTELLTTFETKAVQLGCELALGQLGYFETETSSWEDERSKNVHFYQKNGWIVSSPREDRHAFVLKRLGRLTTSPLNL
jgi:GNAT superfamily N-acetyltransferase